MEPVADPTRKDTARQWATSATNVVGQATSRQSAGPRARVPVEDRSGVDKEATKEVEAEETHEVEPREMEEEKRRRRRRRTRSSG